MIKRIVITTLVLLLGYALVIHFNNNNLNSPQHGEQINVMNGEHYLFTNTDSLKGVIVGSSLAERIVTDSIRGIYNLAFSGFGAQDGLKILLTKKTIPPLIFVETNFSFNEVKESFQKNFDPDFAYPEKLYIPMMRSGNQPFSVILGKLRNRKKPKKSIDTNNNTESGTLFKAMLDVQKHAYSHPDTNMIKRSLLQLKDYVDEVEKRGSKVYFLQMPVNKALIDLPLSKAIRANYARDFPDAKYIPVPDSLVSICKTADGIHLNEYSAWMFTKYFRDYFYKLESK